MKMPSLTNLAENSWFNCFASFYSTTPSSNSVSSISKKIASYIKVLWSFFTFPCKWIYESLCGGIITEVNIQIDAQDENATQLNREIDAPTLTSQGDNLIRSLMIDKVSTLFEKIDQSDTSSKETSKEFLTKNLLKFLTEIFPINEEKNIYLETKSGRRKEIFFSFPLGTDKIKVKEAFYRTEFGIKKFKLSWPDQIFLRNKSDEGAMVCRIYSCSKSRPL